MDIKVYLSLTVFLFTLEFVFSIKDNFFLSPDPSLDLIHNAQPRKLSVAEEFKLFEEELDRGTAKRVGKSRQKRYVFLNTESNVDVGFLIVIPITVVLPGMTNLFNVWRRKRSLPNNAFNFTSEPNSYVQAQVDRISSYFDLVHIPETSCQLRSICELAAEPSKFFPLSDVILTRLRDQYISMHFEASDNSSSTTPSLYDLYSKAADDGSYFGASACEENYAKGCKYSTDKLLDMSIMKFWNNVQSQLRLKFEDVSEFGYM